MRGSQRLTSSEEQQRWAELPAHKVRPASHKAGVRSFVSKIMRKGPLWASGALLPRTGGCASIPAVGCVHVTGQAGLPKIPMCHVGWGEVLIKVIWWQQVWQRLWGGC